eukprot:Rmarinus@m.1326
MNDLDGPLSLLTNTASKDAVQDIKVCVVGASKVGKTASVALLSGQKIVEDDSMSVGLRVTHTLWTCEIQKTLSRGATPTGSVARSICCILACKYDLVGQWEVSTRDIEGFVEEHQIPVFPLDCRLGQDGATHESDAVYSPQEWVAPVLDHICRNAAAS